MVTADRGLADAVRTSNAEVVGRAGCSTGWWTEPGAARRLAPLAGESRRPCHSRASAPRRARRAAWVASASSCRSVGSPLSWIGPVGGGVKVHWPSASGSETFQPSVLRRWQGGQNRRPASTRVVWVCGPVLEVVVLEAEAVVAALAGADRVAPLERGALLAGEPPAEVHDLGDLGALGDDGGEEGVVHPLLHDRHGDRAEPGDLAGLAVDAPGHGAAPGGRPAR